MKATKITALVLAALVLGLVAGNGVSGFAATSTQAPATGCSGLGLRMGAAMRDAGGRLADVVARLTGQNVADVQAKRQAGTSFADIAAEKGVKSSEVVDEALKVREQVLEKRVADGTITQAQADQALTTMRERLTDRVDSTQPGCTGAGAGSGACGAGGGYGMRGGRGSRGAGGAFGGNCAYGAAPVTQ